MPSDDSSKPLPKNHCRKITHSKNIIYQEGRQRQSKAGPKSGARPGQMAAAFAVLRQIGGQDVRLAGLNRRKPVGIPCAPLPHPAWQGVAAMLDARPGRAIGGSSRRNTQTITSFRPQRQGHPVSAQIRLGPDRTRNPGPVCRCVRASSGSALRIAPRQARSTGT